MSWVMASIPLAAVVAGGTVVVSSGSIRAICGRIRSSRRLFLKGGSYEEMTALRVASAPVPAVVPDWDDDVPLAEGLPFLPGAQVQVTIPERVATVAELCRQGWAERIVLSHDEDVYIDWAAEPLEEHRRAARPLPFCHIAQQILPLFHAAGIFHTSVTSPSPAGGIPRPALP